MTTRFPAGINNADNMSTLSNYGAPDPFKFQEVSDDFEFFNTSAWTVVETQAGATQAAAAGAGGRVLFTNSATIADVNAITTNLAIFQLVAGKRVFAKCRMSVSDITNVSLTFGFGDTAAALNPANGIYIQKVGTTYTLVNENTSVQTTSAFVDTSGLTAGTFFTLGIELDNKSLNMYFNDRKVASIDAPNLNTVPNLLGFWGMQNVNAVANTATLDYLMFAVER